MHTSPQTPGLILFTSTLAMLAGGLWLLDLWDFTDQRELKYYSYLAFMALFVAPYIFVLKSKSPIVRWRVGAIGVFFAAIAAPVTFESDHLRYIWDGLAVLNGVNPYANPPSNYQWFADVFWPRYINHAELHTIYPPFAQWTFAASSALNPYFWGEHLGWISGGLEPTSFWQIELGWKTMIGLISAFLVYLLRGHRWDMLVLNPLFLFKGLANGHVDMLVVLCFAPLLIMSFGRRSELKQVLLIAGAVLAKWFPAIILPFFVIHWARKYGWQRALSAALLCVVMIASAVLVFWKGSHGNIFASLKVYGEHWYFFGYIHRFVTDLVALFTPHFTFHYAKYICMGFGAVAGAGILALYYVRAVSLRLALLLLFTAYYALNPTLHPWYMLLILILGRPYYRVLWFTWTWPVLSLASAAYYIHDADPTLVRYTVYGILTAVFYFDGRTIYRSIMKKRSFHERHWYRGVRKDTQPVTR